MESCRMEIHVILIFLNQYNELQWQNKLFVI